MKYSIIVPMFNCEKFADQCLNSLTNQKYENIEILIVDDGSTDSTNKILKEWSKKNDKVKVITKTNGGVSSARNKALCCATGDYVTFLDADDKIDNNMILEVDKILSATNVDILKYGYFKVIGFIRKKYHFSSNAGCIIDKNEYPTEIYANLFKTYDFSNVWNSFISKKIYSKIIFDEDLRYGEDFKFFVDALALSKNIYILDKPFYFYYYNSGSAVNKKSIELKTYKLKNNIQCYEYILNKLELFKNEKVLEQCINRIINDVNDLVISIHYSSKEEFENTVKDLLTNSLGSDVNNLFYNQKKIDLYSWYITKYDFESVKRMQNQNALKHNVLMIIERMKF